MSTTQKWRQQVCINYSRAPTPKHSFLLGAMVIFRACVRPRQHHASPILIHSRRTGCFIGSAAALDAHWDACGKATISCLAYTPCEIERMRSDGHCADCFILSALEVVAHAALILVMSFDEFFDLLLTLGLDEFAKKNHIPLIYF
jgi:hypothetical protein